MPANVDTLTGGAIQAPPHPAGGPPSSASGAHAFLVALGLLFAFVVIMTMVAGISPKVGNGVVAFFLVMLFLQGITHVNPFVQWVEAHPLTPTM